MNAKKAKALRRALIPGKEDTGLSRGDFMRGVKQYTDTNVKGFVMELPGAEPGTTAEFRHSTQTTKLTEDSPRSMYKRFKKELKK